MGNAGRVVWVTVVAQLLSCTSASPCDAGSCTPSCEPQCGAAVCGSDGCGGTCGTCSPGTSCAAGSCVSPPSSPTWQVLSSSSPRWVETSQPPVDACPPQGTGLVTIAFDDGWEAHYTLARPLLLQRGLKGSFFLITGRVGQGWTGYLTMAQAQQLVADGHDIGSHTVNHRDLTTMTAEQIDDELRLSKQWLQTHLGVTADHFVTPFGSYDDRVVAAAKLHYESHGTVEDGINLRGGDAYRLNRVSVQSTTTPAQLRALLEQAQQEHGWLIILFHKLSTGAPTAADDYRISDFEQVLDDVVASGLQVVTVKEGVTRTRCP